MIRTIHLLALGLLLIACDGSAKDAPDAVADKGVDDLPHLSEKGKRFPYLRYADTSPKSRNGRIFFLYPMMDERNTLLALEAGPDVKVEELFAEDMLGISGSVSNEDRMIRIEFLPISLPIEVGEGQEWPMRYAKNEFHCRSRAAASTKSSSDKLAVSCSSGKYALNFVFDRDRGVEEYQDFCGNSVCTFRLVDEEGLLSREVLDHLRLPRI